MELRSWAPQDAKVGRRGVCVHGVRCHRNEHVALAVLAHCLNFLCYLCKEKENTSDRGYGFIIYALHGSSTVWKCWCPTAAALPHDTG